MSYRSTVLADSPLAYYRLGEASGTTAADDSGNAQTGTYVNSPTLGVTGAVDDGNSAVTFASASSQRVLTTVQTGFGNALSACSVEFWLKTTSGATGCVIGSVATGTAGIMQAWINTQDTGSLVANATFFGLRASSGNALRGYIANATVYDGNWHHHVITEPSAGTLSYYLDGAAQSFTYNSQQTIINSAFDFAFTIGGRNNRGTIDTFLNGSVDEMALYGSALSLARVQAHYAASPLANYIPPARRRRRR